MDVLNGLGDPDHETVIGSLGRYRANYSDQLELYFLDERLVEIRVLGNVEELNDDWLIVATDDRRVVFKVPERKGGTRAITKKQSSPSDETGFYFAASRLGDDGIPVHFTPSSVPALMNSNLNQRGWVFSDSSCEGCQTGVCDGVSGCDAMERCQSRNATSRSGNALEAFIRRFISSEFSATFGRTVTAIR